MSLLYKWFRQTCCAFGLHEWSKWSTIDGLPFKQERECMYCGVICERNKKSE